MSNWFFKSSFWGWVLVVVGAIWLAENLFDLDIPVFRVLLSLVLIVLGIALIRGWRSNTGDGSSTVFAKQEHAFTDGMGAHSVLFGEAVIDLTQTAEMAEGLVELRCVFGEMRVKVPRDVNLQVRAEVSFGTIRMPDGRSVSFGTRDYAPAGDGGQTTLRLRVVCAFGEVSILAV